MRIAKDDKTTVASARCMAAARVRHLKTGGLGDVIALVCSQLDAAPPTCETACSRSRGEYFLTRSLEPTNKPCPIAKINDILTRCLVDRVAVPRRARQS